MNCNYTVQGYLVCQKNEQNPAYRRPNIIQQDKCEYLPIQSKYDNTFDNAITQCPKVCEFNNSVYDGNWKPRSCHCCKQ